MSPDQPKKKRNLKQVHEKTPKQLDRSFDKVDSIATEALFQAGFDAEHISRWHKAKVETALTNEEVKHKKQK